MSARARMGAIVLMLAAAFTLCVGEAQAQTAVCSNTPAAGQRIECSESAGSTADITISVQDVTITTDGTATVGIFGRHQGSGDIDIDVRGGTITTEGTASAGIRAAHTGTTGDIDIDVRDATIIVENNNSGIYGENTHGRVRIYAENLVLMTNDRAI